MGLTPEQKQRRTEWFRNHWQNGVAFNGTLGLQVRRWDDKQVEMVMPYRDDLSAHTGIFHGGTVASLIDTVAGGAVLAGHDFDRGSRLVTVSMTVNYLSVAPGEALVGIGRCTRRGRLVSYAAVEVQGEESGKVVAEGLVTVSINGERPGLAAALGEE